MTCLHPWHCSSITRICAIVALILLATTRATPSHPQTRVGPVSAPEEQASKPRHTFRECDKCPEMVVVPAGSFIMGSPDNELNRAKYEGPQHHVTFARQLAVGKFSVTFEEWDACVEDGGCNGYSPKDEGWGRRRRPVINVSWNDANAYVAWLSVKTGKIYRLLSEAEREHVAKVDSLVGPSGDCRFAVFWATTCGTRRSRPPGWSPAPSPNHSNLLGGRHGCGRFCTSEICCHPNGVGCPRYRRSAPAKGRLDRMARAGSRTAFWWGPTISPTQANYNGIYIYDTGLTGEHRQRTVPVDSFRSNRWGIFQVHGNVWEWTQDCWHENYAGAPADGSPWESGRCDYRIVRGGSWATYPGDLGSAVRGRFAIDFRSDSLGFRVARTLAPRDLCGPTYVVGGPPFLSFFLTGPVPFPHILSPPGLDRFDD